MQKPPPQKKPPSQKSLVSRETQYEFRPGQTNANGVTICGANDNGLPCASIMIDPENGRCDRHGGKSARGLAHPNYKTGLYQARYRNVPSKMLQKLTEALGDEDYLSNRDEIALLTSLIDEQLNKLVDCEPDAEKGIYRELKSLISQRAHLTETQLKFEAHRDTHVPMAEVIATVNRIQQIIRDLSFEYFKDEARPFLTELQNRLQEVLFGRK